MTRLLLAPYLRRLLKQRAAHIARLAKARAEIFTATSAGRRTGEDGSVTDPTVETLRLPGAGWLLQWRSDGFWRGLSEAESRAGLLPTEDEWGRWTGSTAPHGHGGDWGGTPVWWSLYGELPRDATADVVLADGSRPPVLRVGNLWACEWKSVAQPATVHVAGDTYDIPFAEPNYRRR